MRCADNASKRMIAHANFARLAVQFEEERARAIGMRLADGKKSHDQRFSGLDLDGDFLFRVASRRNIAGVGSTLTSE